MKRAPSTSRKRTGNVSTLTGTRSELEQLERARLGLNNENDRLKNALDLQLAAADSTRPLTNPNEQNIRSHPTAREGVSSFTTSPSLSGSCNHDFLAHAGQHTITDYKCFKSNHRERPKTQGCVTLHQLQHIIKETAPDQAHQKRISTWAWEMKQLRQSGKKGFCDGLLERATPLPSLWHLALSPLRTEGGSSPTQPLAYFTRLQTQNTTRA
ncbi:hypothetical protein S40293_11528 [Stachybotrys chartarum IBT 40293]|nr:hypothetical protein S40293_11528 [Stachybotrys chartarum IBT 40293]